MSEPTSGGSQEIGKAHFSVGLKDDTDKGLKSIDQKIKTSSDNTRRQIQQTAQIARNSVAIAVRSVGSNITNTVLEPIISVGESFLRAAEDAEVGGTRIQKTMKMVQIGGAGLMGAGFGLALLGAREKQAFDQLSNAIDDLGLSTSDYREEIEKVVTQQESWGHTAIQTEQALQLLTNATHDPTAALNDMGEVADLAASRHQSLDQAARQVAITIGGGGRLLKQYNIDIIKNADGTRNYAAMNAKLADVLHGQAAAAVDNLGGKIRVLGVEIEDTVAKFGQKWGPTMSVAGAGMMAFSTIVEIVANKRLGKLLTATQAVAAAQAEESAATTMTTEEIVAALSAQTEAANATAAAFANMAASSEVAGASGVAAAGAGAGAAGEGVLAGSAAAGTGAVIGSEDALMASTGRMQAFWDEVMANMAADIEASATVVTGAISEEEASFVAFATAFDEAFASMAAAAGGATAEEIAALGATAAAADATAADIVAAGGVASEGWLAMIGPLGLVGGALAAVAVGAGAWDMMSHKLSYDAQAAVPPMNALTEAIKEHYGALDKDVMSQIDASAASNGLLPALNQLGITTEEFNAAVKAGPAGLEELGKKINMTTLNSSSLHDSFTVMGKTFDTHEQVLSMIKKSYDSYSETLGKTVRMSQAEVEATSNLTDEQIAQARALGISIPAYADMISKITDKTAKQVSEEETQQALIASSQNLSDVLNLSSLGYNEVTSSLLHAIDAQRAMNETVRAVEDVHSFFDPALTAYQQWQDAAQSITQAQQQETQTAISGAHSVAQAKRQERDAEQAVTDARKQGRKDIADAVDNEAKAEQDAASKIAQANKNVVDSEIAAKDATVAVTAARAKAQQQVEDSIRTLRDMAENEQKARDALLAAQLDAQQKAHDAAQDALNASVGLTQQQLIDQQATLDQQQHQIDQQRTSIANRTSQEAIVDAQHKLNDLLKDDVQTRKDANKVIKDGVRNNPDVLKALRAQRDATAAVTKAKKDQVQAEKDAAKEIKDAEQKVTEARQKAAADIKKALQSQSDAEYSLKQAEQQQMTANDNARKAVDKANQSYDDSRRKLTEVEIQTGQTDGSLKKLQTTMHNMDKALTLKYQATGVGATGQATVLLQRAIEETLLEAGGATPAEARRRARTDIPDWGKTSAPKPPTRPGGGGQGPVRVAWSGGPIRGGSGGQTADDIPTLLSNNEHVWTAAEVQAAGGHETVRRMRQAALEGAFQAFAGGGAVGPVIDTRRMHISDRLKNSGALSMLGKGYYGTDKYGKFAMGGWPNEAAVANFIRAVDKLPYVFGAVGPGAYDCSGLVGEVWARLTGHPSFHRYFSTENESGYFEPGPGRFTVGVTNRNGTNHTAGRLNGLKFEARDSAEGIITGSAAMDPERFDWVGHLKERSGYPTNQPGGGIGNVGLSGHLSPSAARQAGMAMMPSGWNWADLNNVFTRESGWRWNAYNPAGPAYGIPQALPPNKMSSAGSDWHDNAATQLKWGLGYIRDRYGNPTKARAHEDAFNWYDQGGVLPPGPSLTMNGTGKPEAIFTKAELQKLIDNKGISIENVNFKVDISEIDDVKKLMGILNALPQAIRAKSAASIRKVS